MIVIPPHNHAQPNCPACHALAAHYVEIFIPNGANQHAVMNPAWADAKYSRKSGGISSKLITSIFDNAIRRLKNDGKWIAFPLSIAITPQTPGKNPSANVIAIDIDSGGIDALAKVLTCAKQYGLWGFAQVSESADHSGGHIWLPCAAYQPAPMLKEIAERLAIAAGVTGEYYPTQRDLRLPLMPHVRAPGGPRRFPLLMQEGDFIDADDPWAALEMLSTRLQRNGATVLVDALDKLPPLPVGGGEQPIHRSKVNPSRVDSVINWYNDNHTLKTLLEDAGATVDHRVICCPYHEDNSPSLAIFRNASGKDVCRCFSAQSNCPLAAGVYFDAFDLHKLAVKLSTVEAVKRLVKEHNIGKTTETVIERHEPEQPAIPLEQHKTTLTAAREKLQQELTAAAQRRGDVTVIRATPGLGKTHMAAEIANAEYRQGKKIAICAPTLPVAEQEWAPRLDNPYVWQSKIKLCTCHEKEYLMACRDYGYDYPECISDRCPYMRQAQASFGKQIVYQHPHLHIKDGHRLSEADLVIIDESPLNALLPEKSVGPGRLERFAEKHPDDPATPLLAAIARAMRALPHEMNDIRGLALEVAIGKELGSVTLADAIRQAKKSPYCEELPQPPDDTRKMTPQFLFGLLKALDGNFDKVSFGRTSNGKMFWGLVWHDRQLMALRVKNLLPEFQAAFIVLDGSADETIYNTLLSPWSLQMIDVHCDLSPTVELVQVSCTPSTRQVVKDDDKIVRLVRQIAHVCNKLKVLLDGGVTYMGAIDALQAHLGGEWLHYGGQRGQNALADAQAIAVVCSPTIPPVALERKALALWKNIETEWKPTGKTGEYRATDERLEALARIHGLEELRQAVYRVRPLSAEKPVKLLVFTPWDLSLIGLKPTITVDEIEHGNAAAVTAAISEYKKRRAGASLPLPVGGGAVLNPPKRLLSEEKAAIKSPFSIRKNIYESPPRIENGQNIAENASYSKIVANAETTEKSPPLPARGDEVPACAFVSSSDALPHKESLSLTERMLTFSDQLGFTWERLPDGRIWLSRWDKELFAQARQLLAQGTA